MLGEIPMLGRTVGEIETLITDRLKGRYFVESSGIGMDRRIPIVLRKWYGGETWRLPLPARVERAQGGIDHQQFKERASVNKIFIVRDKDAAHQPAKVDLNADVGPGDTITVEESFF